MHMWPGCAGLDPRVCVCDLPELEPVRGHVRGAARAQLALPQDTIPGRHLPGR